MSNASPIMSDRDVAEYLGVSVYSIRRRLANPVKGEIDLNEAEPKVVAGRRFWLRSNIEKMLGITKR